MKVGENFWSAGVWLGVTPATRVSLSIEHLLFFIVRSYDSPDCPQD
jgi:hypothetical protein